MSVHIEEEELGDNLCDVFIVVELASFDSICLKFEDEYVEIFPMDKCHVGWRVKLISTSWMAPKKNQFGRSR